MVAARDDLDEFISLCRDCLAGLRGELALLSYHNTNVKYSPQKAYMSNIYSVATSYTSIALSDSCIIELTPVCQAKAKGKITIFLSLEY